MGLGESMGLCGVLWDWTIIWDYMGLGEKVQDRDFAAGVGERVGMWECAGVTPLSFGNSWSSLSAGCPWGSWLLPPDVGFP